MPSACVVQKIFAAVNDPLHCAFYGCVCSICRFKYFLDLDECLNLLYFAVYLGLRNVHAGILHKFTISMLWGLLSLNEELITMYEEHTALEVWNPSLRLFEKIIA